MSANSIDQFIHVVSPENGHRGRDLLISVSSQHNAQALQSGFDQHQDALVTLPDRGKPPDNPAFEDGIPRLAATAIVREARGWWDSMRPGDLIIASEVFGTHGRSRFRSADILAGELRRSGFRVHVGPIAPGDSPEPEASTPPRLGYTVTPAGSGPIDLPEDFQEFHSDSTLGLIFVVASTLGQESADTVNRQLIDDTLNRLSPVLLRWARVGGAREVLLAGPRSLCAGVERAIEIVERALELFPHPIYVRKQIVHNVHVVRDLEQRGVIFVDEVDEVPDHATLVFSAHGVSPQVRAAAADRQLRVIDATCPLVTKVHAKARRFVKRGDTVLLIGHAGHEETEGTLGQSPGNIVLIDDAEDIAKLDLSQTERVSYVTQTTLAVDEAQEVVDELRIAYPQLQDPGTEDICYATTNRQEAIKAVADDVDLVLVVGSTNSSNSVRLVEIARRQGKAAYLIDDASDIEFSWLHEVDTVGLTGGASAPASLLNAVIENLRGLGPVEVTERIVTTEEIQFTLPKEVRRR